MADAFCSIEIPDYVQKECGIERAGIVAIGLIDTDQNPTNDNLSSKTYWTAQLAASPPTHFKILQTRGEYPGGSPTEEDGFGRESTQVTGADHEATVEVEGLLDNRDFWEGVNRKKWKVAFVTNGDLIIYVDTPVTVYSKINNPRSIKSGAFWMVSFKWQSYDNPQVVEAPADIFED